MLKVTLLGFFLLACAACSSNNKSSDDKAATQEKASSSSSSSSSSVANNSSSEASSEQEEINEAVIDTALSAVRAESGPSISVPLTPSKAVLQAKSLPYLSTIPLSATEVDEKVEQGECGGTLTTITENTSPDDQTESFTLTSRVTSTYNDYCYSEGYYINGSYKATVEYNANNDYSYSIQADMQLSGALFGEAYNYKYSQTCIYSDGTADCDDGIWYESTSGTSYELQDYSVDVDSNDNYSISGTFTSDGESAVNYVFSATNLTLCENGNFGSGVIELTLNGSVYLRIEFSSCDQYAYYIDGYSGTVNY